MEKLITIEIARSEKELILNISDLDTELERKLKVMAVYGNTLKVKFPLEKMNTLLDSLEREANDTTDENLRKAYGDLHDKIERAIKANQ